MFSTYSDVKKFIEKEQVEAIDLRYVDLRGQWRHVTLPASDYGYAMLREGVGFDGSSVGFKKAYASDMALLAPDLSTAMIDPFCQRKTLAFISEMVEADSRAPSPLDPRGVARRAEQHLAKLDWVDTSMWGPEMEFNVLDGVSFNIGLSQSGYQIHSCEATLESGDGLCGPRILPSDGYHAMPPADSLYNLRAEIAAHLEAIGIEIKYHHHEGGSAGQMEIEIPLDGLLKAADTVMLIKYVAKMVSRKWGRSATFMPKPIPGDNGNGMHVHQSLWKGKRNLFFSENGYGGLSDIALSYIAGLLAHGPALLAFTSPSTNSFRRLVPGFEAPTHLFFSIGNRTAAVRIPAYANTEETKRIEFRPPDASCNIYFCLAAQLLAGLDGIGRKIESGDYGPFDEDIHTWPEERLVKLKAVPGSLGEALEELRHDHDFLLQGQVFSQQLIEIWIEYKTKHELIPMQERPHPYEFALYFDA